MLKSIIKIIAYHIVSVFPKKELPFFILFTAGLCSGTATLALLTHQYPEYTTYVAKLVFFCSHDKIRYI
jgi:hypothetical protein